MTGPLLATIHIFPRYKLMLMLLHTYLKINTPMQCIIPSWGNWHDNKAIIMLLIQLSWRFEVT